MLKLNLSEIVHCAQLYLNDDLIKPYLVSTFYVTDTLVDNGDKQ